MDACLTMSFSVLTIDERMCVREREREKEAAEARFCAIWLFDDVGSRGSARNLIIISHHSLTFNISRAAMNRSVPENSIDKVDPTL